jgi:hypothetical protein
MKLFLSWSGETSKSVALLLRDWLPQVINEVEPFMSSEDIEKGARGLDVLASELQDSAYGIVVVTKDNFQRAWINFEAGAVSKHISKSRLTPLLFRVEYTQITGPLTQFQYVLPTQEDMRKLLHGINAVCERRMDAARLDKSFDKWWDDLSASLEAVPSPALTEKPRRDPDELLAEILQVVRGLQREVSELKVPVQPNKEITPILSYRISYTGGNPEHEAKFLEVGSRLNTIGVTAARVEGANPPAFVILDVDRPTRARVDLFFEHRFPEGSDALVSTFPA